MNSDIETIRQYLSSEADSLLNFYNPKIKKESLNLPGPDFVDRIYIDSDRGDDQNRRVYESDAQAV